MNNSFSEEFEEEEEMSIADDIEMIREDLIGELQAINQYEEHILSLDNEEAVTTLEHILEEEKEHVAELLALIQGLDSIQAEKLKRHIP
ncbi:MAG: demethoxyubiquinone hydroxylase family protein [Chloroflexota bacterium]|nr:demethoxyubiquinone hydroxylase family protein [Chloroflexota bacterium]